MAQQTVSNGKKNPTYRRKAFSALHTRHDDPDVKAIREYYNMTQQEFSVLLGISVATLQNWEQGRRRPQGPAKVLLKIAEKRPKAIIESLAQDNP